MVVGSNPTGSTRSIRIRQPVCSFVWISGVVAERSNATVPKAAGVQAPGGSNPPTPRTPHENRSHEGGLSSLAGVPLNRKHWHGWWAVRQRRSPAKTVGAEVPGEFDSRTIASRSAVIGHGIGLGIQSAKRVGSAWRNAVGHTCPMRSRAFLLGVTAAHGSLEPLVLVRIQEEELGGSTSN